MTRVSVIIPTYNRAGSLSRAIDSALAQTVDDLEVVVVDDGSTDETATVLSAYDDRRVRPIVHATNQGANVARNTGLAHARGEYVAFLDSDDVWDPTKLERQLAVLEGRSEAWVGAYCDSTLELSGTSGLLRTTAATVLASGDEQPTMEGGDELIGEILADNVQPGAGSTLLVRTNVARAVGGFDEELDRFQDPEFCLRVLEAGNLAYVDEELVVREDTGQPSADLIRGANEAYRERYADTIDRFEAEGYDIHSSHELILAKAYASEGRILRAAWHLRNAGVAPRQYPGLGWAVATGVRRRPAPVAVIITVLTLLSAIVVGYGVHTVSGRLEDE
ncbi:Glycosyl transferase family 2 [Natronorubrum sediminis]|uniref:Glycosyl transferase family 2 n=1 Tax=Natronorubrum sediminis TaxID=640943 RepID=A0A1H6FN29_9EURY|nr:glycosyltransferase family 2 protein [Natronorubrum sediminis]SEH11752.1 Glycosyl transferase family 2 [Natronorubrum sediminis]